MEGEQHLLKRRKNEKEYPNKEKIQELKREMEQTQEKMRKEEKQGKMAMKYPEMFREIVKKCAKFGITMITSALRSLMKPGKEDECE